MLRALLSGERATQPPCGLVLRWGRYGIVLVLPAKPQEGGRGRSLDMRGGVEPPISIVHRKVPVRPRLVPGSPCTSLCRARADSAAPAWVDPAQGPKDGDLNRCVLLLRAHLLRALLLNRIIDKFTGVHFKIWQINVTL
ncbi:hypothetical protein E2562_038678 [Oryza meyeriana var. granulata]|uniref:Uncharacterized protein n=1 Tax=Oryza meyeriana var. granulata TaxID=110450 RepID=A0A6G1CMA9_9ORYZ|nr:hypothetical protein E2562_038678 [Oryza meyeriana var. granulata]KAF0901221.1 hypothetical protein E2562_038678 [Oryza meyeriana var. granulata]KAF0901223.1 hypothetical protein E2562_038678 [Oryza meyeriana var. granulata]